jgi:iron complex transport system permease protein
MTAARERSMTAGHLTFKKTLGVCGALLLLLVCILIVAALLGSQRLPITSSLCALAGGSNCGLSSEQQAILFDLRLPRILLAGAVGMCLASAGAGYQALLRNPLAEPYLLGVSNGAAVGTMIALVFFGVHEWSRPVMAFAGALIATLVVYQLARGRDAHSLVHVLVVGRPVGNHD